MIAVPDESDGWVGLGCSPRALDTRIVAIEVVIFRGESGASFFLHAAFRSKMRRLTFRSISSVAVLQKIASGLSNFVGGRPMRAAPDEADGWVGLGCSPRALDSRTIAIFEVVIFRGDEGVSTSILEIPYCVCGLSLQELLLRDRVLEVCPLKDSVRVQQVNSSWMGA